MLSILLLTACTNPKDEYLWQASMRGQPDNVRSFIRDGADPNYVRGGWSIIMRVAEKGRPDVAEILIENGAKINFKGKDGASALTIAAEHGNAEVIQVLLAKGRDVNIRNDHGNSPLMYSAQYGHPCGHQAIVGFWGRYANEGCGWRHCFSLGETKRACGHCSIAEERRCKRIGS